MTEVEPLPLPVVDPYSMLPEIIKDVPHPTPVLTSLEAAAMGWEWWIGPALTLQKRAVLAGWECRLGFARGYKPGRKKNTYELWDTVCAWLHQSGRPRMAFTWERSPDQGNTWKAARALMWSGDRCIGMGHTEAKGLL